MKKIIENSNSKQTVVVVGMGVVGLPAALLLANANHKVIGVDINKGIVDALSKGILPPHIKEKELQTLLQESTVKKNFHVQLVPSQGDSFVIAVPTPVEYSKKRSDLSLLEKATESIVPYLKKGNLVIIESTIPPLTCRNLVAPILEKSGLKVGKDILLAHCPERVLPGNIYHEIIHNDRIIGGINKESSEEAKKLYSSFVKGKIYVTDDVTAEFCKLMENSFRDVNIALANEFSAVAEGLGIDPKEAIQLSNKHPRVNILNPGIGVGGHCIPIDPWFIYEVDAKNSTLIATARKINDGMPKKIAEKISRAVKNNKKAKIVALGASYKVDTADLRESPAINIVKILREDGFQVDHYDPLISTYQWDKDLPTALRAANLLVVLVPHAIILSEINKYRSEIKRILGDSNMLFF
ncbi:MAG: nucleotide sugar dehydrogenase [Candidatus Parcubacteria bacterium]|nr:nucleotide sugar dehydrogenase [Candidatus Parcubacteria bacterium]